MMRKKLSSEERSMARNLSTATSGCGRCCYAKKSETNAHVFYVFSPRWLLFAAPTAATPPSQREFCRLPVTIKVKVLLSSDNKSHIEFFTVICDSNVILAQIFMTRLTKCFFSAPVNFRRAQLLNALFVCATFVALTRATRRTNWMAMNMPTSSAIVQGLCIRLRVDQTQKSET
jgi:hypothetical protein